MQNKPQKWGLKVCCLACSTLKYVWNFKIYCGKENPLPQVKDPIDMANSNVPVICRRKLKLSYNVVLKMMDGFASLGHFVVLDRFFSSIVLFMELLSIETMQ